MVVAGFGYITEFISVILLAQPMNPRQGLWCWKFSVVVWFTSVCSWLIILLQFYILFCLPLSFSMLQAHLHWEWEKNNTTRSFVFELQQRFNQFTAYFYSYHRQQGTESLCMQNWHCYPGHQLQAKYTPLLLYIVPTYFIEVQVWGWEVIPWGGGLYGIYTPRAEGPKVCISREGRHQVV